MEIRVDDPRRAAVRALLLEHLATVASISPPESTHALDIDALCSPRITFWTATQGPDVLGCGALLQLDPAHGEIKSMRTARAHLRKGVASRILERIIAEAERRRYTRLSLETGSQDEFAPARAFYTGFGVEPCGPFADYRPDPNSVFMTRVL